MHRSATRFLVLLTIFVTLATAATSRAVEITFQVRMSFQVELGSFDPGSDFVDIAGTFNGWGTSPLTPLADADGDSIYAVTIGGFTPSETIEYKYRMNGQWDGTEEFPGVGNNRFHTVGASDDTILVWYNNLTPNGGPAELNWWNDAVFYEIFVRSFYDSDGDGIGDLAGLTQKLDYLNDGNPNTEDDLGVTGIWLMPTQDSPSYHGYDGVDYRSINPDYGTMADFQTFLAAAHARGIKVIIDFVMNHCSNQHPWFVAASQNDPFYRDWFRWSDTDPGETGPWGQQVWHWHPSDWYYGLFTSGMPDLNYDTQAVKDTMFDTATYWLDTIGVDGFRLDAVLYIDEDGSQHQNTPGTLQFWQDYNTHVKAVKPDAMSVGEAWTSTSVVVQYATQDRLDFCFEFDLSYATTGAVNAGDAGYLSTKANEVYLLYPYLQFGTFLANHDQDRVLNVLGFDEDRNKVAAAIYLTLPGVPFVYYGEEVGMIGSGDHLNIRTPMQWTAGANAGFTTGTPWRTINGNYPLYNVAVEEVDPNSLLEWYKRLIHVRNGSLALRRGAHHPLTTSDSPVMAFVRKHDQQMVLCIYNTGANALGSVTVAGSVLEPGDHRLANLLVSGDTLNATVTPANEINGLSLDGYEVRIYEFAVVTGVDSRDGASPDTGLLLEQNYPNPFNPTTTITYALDESTDVSLRIYDAAGTLVRTLVDGRREARHHRVEWDGHDQEGNSVASGVYFYRLEGGGEALTKKMVLLK